MNTITRSMARKRIAAGQPVYIEYHDTTTGQQRRVRVANINRQTYSDEFTVTQPDGSETERLHESRAVFYRS